MATTSFAACTALQNIDFNPYAWAGLGWLADELLLGLYPGINTTGKFQLRVYSQPLKQTQPTIPWSWGAALLCYARLPACN